MSSKFANGAARVTCALALIWMATACGAESGGGDDDGTGMVIAPAMPGTGGAGSAALPAGGSAAPPVNPPRAGSSGGAGMTSMGTAGMAMAGTSGGSGRGGAGGAGSGGAGAGGTGSGGAGSGGSDEELIAQCITDVMAGGDTQACSECLCTKCGMQLDLCANDEMPAGDGAKCEAIIACAGRTNCDGDACYCNNPPPTGCYAGGGPCELEINASATGGSVLNLNMDKMTPGHPLYQSIQVGMCNVANCSSVCM